LCDLRPSVVCAPANPNRCLVHRAEAREQICSRSDLERIEYFSDPGLHHHNADHQHTCRGRDSDAAKRDQADNDVNDAEGDDPAPFGAQGLLGLAPKAYGLFSSLHSCPKAGFAVRFITAIRRHEGLLDTRLGRKNSSRIHPLCVRKARVSKDIEALDLGLASQWRVKSTTALRSLSL
jgi:hypothetical protein